MKIAIITIVVVLVASVVYLVIRKPKAIDKSLATYTGPVVEYAGEKKLIVAFAASWASVWIVTEQELGKLDRSKFDLCILDQAYDQDEIRSFGITFLPTVALIEDGKIIKREQNLMSIDQLKDW